MFLISASVLGATMSIKREAYTSRRGSMHVVAITALGSDSRTMHTSSCRWRRDASTKGNLMWVSLNEYTVYHTSLVISQLSMLTRT
jgi:hypothetical protein